MTRAVAASLTLLTLLATGCGSSTTDTAAEETTAGTVRTPTSTVTTVPAKTVDETCEQVMEPPTGKEMSLLGATNAYAVDLRDTDVFDEPLQQRGRDLIEQWEPVVTAAEPSVREHLDQLAAVPIDSVAAADRDDARLDIQFRDYAAAAEAIEDVCA